MDAYIFRLEGLPDSKKPLHLVIPAPLKSLTVGITLRSLITTYGRYYQNVLILGETNKRSIRERIDVPPQIQTEEVEVLQA